jgi:hypothetical protein
MGATSCLRLRIAARGLRGLHARQSAARQIDRLRLSLRPPAARAGRRSSLHHRELLGRGRAHLYGVLEALRDTMVTWQGRRVSLLAEVDVISSISGRSFPAAYYALRGEKIFDEFRQVPLPAGAGRQRSCSHRRQLVQAPGRDSGPATSPRVLAAGLWREHYADVIARNQRPFVVLNAADATTGTVSFIQDQFDLLCSDLAGAPLARGHPRPRSVGLSALTFQNYAGGCDIAGRAGWARGRRPRLAREPGAHGARRTACRSRRSRTGRRSGHSSTSPTAASRTASACAGPRLRHFTNTPYSVLQMVNNQRSTSWW